MSLALRPLTAAPLAGAAVFSSGPGSVRALCFTPDGSRLAAGTSRVEDASLTEGAGRISGTPARAGCWRRRTGRAATSSRSPIRRTVDCRLRPRICRSAPGRSRWWMRPRTERISPSGNSPGTFARRPVLAGRKLPCDGERRAIGPPVGREVAPATASACAAGRGVCARVLAGWQPSGRRMWRRSRLRRAGLCVGLGDRVGPLPLVEAGAWQRRRGAGFRAARPLSGNGRQRRRRLPLGARNGPPAGAPDRAQLRDCRARLRAGRSAVRQRRNPPDGRAARPTRSSCATPTPARRSAPSPAARTPSPPWPTTRRRPPRQRQPRRHDPAVAARGEVSQGKRPARTKSAPRQLSAAGPVTLRAVARITAR